MRRNCAETAAISRGISHVTTNQGCKYTTWLGIHTLHAVLSGTFQEYVVKQCSQFDTAVVKLVIHSESCTTRAQGVCSGVENSAVLKATNQSIDQSTPLTSPSTKRPTHNLRSRSPLAPLAEWNALAYKRHHCRHKTPKQTSPWIRLSQYSSPE